MKDIISMLLPQETCDELGSIMAKTIRGRQRRILGGENKK